MECGMWNVECGLEHTTPPPVTLSSSRNAHLSPRCLLFSFVCCWLLMTFTRTHTHTRTPMPTRTQTQTPLSHMFTCSHVHMQGVAFFNDRLGSLCMSWLTDSVHAIRAAATANLRALTEVFGSGWATTHVIPTVRKIFVGVGRLCRGVCVCVRVCVCVCVRVWSGEWGVLPRACIPHSHSHANSNSNCTVCVPLLAAVAPDTPTAHRAPRRSKP